jgi:hypothetical protein
MLNQISFFLYDMDCSSFLHIYRELNSKADDLSKEALDLEEGVLIS